MTDTTYRLLIAKSGSEPSFWLPLWMHHRDTAEVMNFLLDEFVSPSFAVSCGMDVDVMKKTAKFLALVHDIGKATAGFQYKIAKSVPLRASVLERYGLKLPDSMDMMSVSKTSHALAGESILLLMGCPEGIAAAVGAHHGEPNEKGNIAVLKSERKNIVNYRNYYGDEKGNRDILEETWRKITDYALRSAGLDTVNEIEEISAKAQMILSGLLITADWIASNTEFFPLISIDELGEESFYPDRTNFALEKLSFTEMWGSKRRDYESNEFRHTFGFLPSGIQKEIIDIVKGTTAPGLFILEAPMGCGKTEAALSSAELLAAKCGKNGVFFGMPTQATANGIFPRIMSWAEKQSGEYFHSIQLKHGGAEFNETFRKIQRGIPDEESDSGLVVHSWFCNSKKACLANFVTATVDQMLMMALKRRHVMLLHLGLSEKVVIIDEVHAYDAYMNQYLERALQWLGAYKTPVILLSATMPAKKRMSLVRAYLSQKRSDECFEKNISYPLLTYTDGDCIRQDALPYEGEHKKVEINECTDDDILETVRAAVKAGGCAGIIVNTVSRAQTIAQAVRKDITCNVLLYHAQFIMPDRAAKENELLNKIGKNSNTDTRAGFVVIGTQVLEQSLDIDFDMLITDICPADLLLQRIGRLHRHTRIRPDELSVPKCFVITDEYRNESSGSRKIYGTWLLKETLGILPGKETLPDDISPLVQQVYGAFDDSEEYKSYINSNDISVNKAKAFLLKKPGRSIHGLLDRSVSDSQAEASVRDGISSIEVLVLKLYEDGSVGLMNGTKLSADITDEECELIASQRLRLPCRFSYNIDRTIGELENTSRQYAMSWNKHCLFKDQLILFFNENNESDLADYHLKYDFVSGLICEKRSGEVE